MESYNSRFRLKIIWTLVMCQVLSSAFTYFLMIQSMFIELLLVSSYYMLDNGFLIHMIILKNW